jgi:hypothetical protein
MASALLTALALAACSSKTDSDSSDSAETATSSPCQLQQAIPLGDSFDLVLSGLHLVDVKTDQDPTFPNPALYHRSTDTLDLDGFEVLSQNALTMVLGATLSIHGSNDPDAQVGFVPNTATVFDGWGYQRFEQGALTYWSQQSRGTPGGKPAVAEVKATIANQQLTAIRMIVPV